MKKNIYLTILMLVTAGCMIFGVLRRMTDLFPGKETVLKTEITSEVEMGPNEMPERIEADMDMGNLILRTGDAFRIAYEGKDNLEPVVRFEKGTLSIKQKKEKKLSFGIHKNEKAELLVVIPKGLLLAGVDVDLDLGKIEMEDLQIGQSTVQNDLGDIDIRNCTFDKMDIDIDAGDLDVRDCTFRSLEIDQDLGDVTVSTPQDMTEADIDMKISLGSLRVNGTEHGQEFIRQGGGKVTLTVSNDLGDIDLRY